VSTFPFKAKSKVKALKKILLFFYSPHDFLGILVREFEKKLKFHQRAKF
jgi:hypothetical protein